MCGPPARLGRHLTNVGQGRISTDWAILGICCMLHASLDRKHARNLCLAQDRRTYSAYVVTDISPAILICCAVPGCAGLLHQRKPKRLVRGSVLCCSRPCTQTGERIQNDSTRSGGLAKCGERCSSTSSARPLPRFPGVCEDYLGPDRCNGHEAASAHHTRRPTTLSWKPWSPPSASRRTWRLSRWLCPWPWGS